jgi:hypothetical protein
MKLGNPFGAGRTIRITRVAHNNLGQLSSFSMTQANDINASPFQAEVYAEGNGNVIVAQNSTNPNSFLRIAYDGMPSDLLYELVHVRPAVGIGRITKGQLIGTLEPYRANWYGTGIHHNPHLHHQILSQSKSGAPNPFSYMDRSVKVIATHPEILAYQNWFINGVFNWAKFPDLSLSGGTTMKIGDRVELTAISNIRGGSGTSFPKVGDVAAGAVGEIIDGPRTAGGYTWYDVRFLNNQGWIANVGGTRLKVTTKPIGNVDTTVPAPLPPTNPCSAQDAKIIDLERQIVNYKAIEDKYIREANEYKTTISTLDIDNKKLRAERTELEALIEKMEQAYELVFEERNDFSDQVIRLERQIVDLKEEVKRLKDFSLEDLKFSDLLVWVGIKLGIRKTE